MKSNVVGIVGGSGFVGSSLAKHLRSSFEIIVFDQRPVSRIIGDEITFRQCDIRDYNDVREKVKDVDLLINTAIVQIPLINENKRLGYEVNVLGTQNVCQAVQECDSIRGLLLSGSWHILVESAFQETRDKGMIKTEERSKYYTLTKLCQELIVKSFDQMSEKAYGIIRLGTVLGEGMPEQTAASIFMSRGLEGKAITPFKHSMYRPMLYADIKDVCKGFERYATRILNGKVQDKDAKGTPTVNLVYPKPYTILEIANLVKSIITIQSGRKIDPAVEIIDKKLPSSYAPEDKEAMNIDITKPKEFLGLDSMTSPEKSLERMIARRLNHT